MGLNFKCPNSLYLLLWLQGARRNSGTTGPKGDKVRDERCNQISFYTLVFFINSVSTSNKKQHAKILGTQEQPLSNHPEHSGKSVATC